MTPLQTSNSPLKSSGAAQSTSKGWRWLGMFLLCCLFAATSACQLETESDPEVHCQEGQVVQAQNPATGECEWIASCSVGSWEFCGGDDFSCEDLPLDVCGLDQRCDSISGELCPDCIEGMSCECFETTACVSKPDPNSCADLGEGACINAPECVPSYEGGYGESTPGSGSTPSTGGETPPGEPTDGGVPAPIPGLDHVAYYSGFLSCGPAPTSNSCAQLDEPSCIDKPGCEPFYQGIDCACADPALNNANNADPSMPACDCPQMEDSYAGCGDARSEGCFDIYDPEMCHMVEGCYWDSAMDGTGTSNNTPNNNPIACICEEGVSCDCDGDTLVDPYYYGACVPGEEPPADCWDLSDSWSCQSDSACQWNEEGGGEVPPCDCSGFAPDEPCACAPMPYGYCSPKETFQCSDASTPDQCWSDMNCEWIGVGTTTPDCPPGEDCMPFMEEGYCQDSTPSGCEGLYDPDMCVISGCDWVEDGGITEFPCADCTDPNDPACECGSGDPMPEPWGYCTEPAPSQCGDHFDANACLSSGCAWEDGDAGRPVPPMECFDSQPVSDGCVNADGSIAPDYCCNNGDPIAPGFCYEPEVPVDTCEMFTDVWSCGSTSGCEWSPDSSDEAPLWDECADAYLTDNGSCVYPDGLLAPGHCCEETRPPLVEYGPYCVSAATPPPTSECTFSSDPMSCTSAPGCGWVDFCSACPECDWICSFCIDTSTCDGVSEAECGVQEGCGFYEGICQPLTACPFIADAQGCEAEGCSWRAVDPLPCDCAVDDPSCVCASIDGECTNP